MDWENKEPEEVVSNVSSHFFRSIIYNPLRFFSHFVNIYDKGMWKQFFIENCAVSIHKPVFALFQSSIAQMQL